MNKDTIVATATPPGRGGVGIIRLSGPDAYRIGTLITRKKSITPRNATFCSFKTPDNEILDQGLVLYFNPPFSFTGDAVVELHAHGSPLVLDQLITVCIHYGARLAKPGEFSERAFLNNKIDLVQAEAIADLIQASSETAARMAMRSLQGDFSKQLHALNEQLIYLRMYIEAAIDFVEEDISFLAEGHVATKLDVVIKTLQRIRSTANQGAIIREGISIVIAGKPNAGKSTLINALSGREVAIVTDIPGTTRDVMRADILLDDIPLHIIDTAGLRDSLDPIEQEGIKRAWQEVTRADCILLVRDANDESDLQAFHELIQRTVPPEVPIIHVINKIDTRGYPPTSVDKVISVSAKNGEGLPLLRLKIKEVIGYQPTEGLFLARRRHLQAMDEALMILINGQQQLLLHQASELVAEDLRLAHQYLCEITGEFTSDDLLGTIFSSFCIGK